MHKKANEIMRGFIESQAKNSPAKTSGGDSAASGDSRKRAQDAWESS
jgi:hypothetical protein